jgi:recombinational DNA repair protein (RecF pathway)
MGVDATPDFRVAESRIHKFADIVPVFTELAGRREELAKAAEKAQRTVAAREHYFHAALLYVTAEWPSS